MPLATTSVKIEAELKERLQKLAESRRRSTNWLMREAIREFVTREEERAELDRVMLERWAEFEATGKHVSEQAADAWFARLESGEKIPPPEPEC